MRAIYAVERDLRWITVIAHGGEPALLGAGRLDHLFGTVTDALTAVGVKVNLGMQTNGTMVDAPLVKVLQRHGVRAGVSVDGPRRSTIGIVSTSVERERPYVRWRASNISSTP